MAQATVDSHYVWLGLTAVPKLDQCDLLGAHVMTQGLFGLIFSVVQHLRRLEVQSSQLSRCFSLAHIQRGNNEKKRRNATVRRREQHCYRAMVLAALDSSLDGTSSFSSKEQHTLP